MNERFLEFGHEGIRKYDLMRWNLLATKIAEARTKIQQIRDRTGAYANVPQYIYWRNNGEEIQYYTGVGCARKCTTILASNTSTYPNNRMDKSGLGTASYYCQFY